MKKKKKNPYQTINSRTISRSSSTELCANASLWCMHDRMSVDVINANFFSVLLIVFRTSSQRPEYKRYRV